MTLFSDLASTADGLFGAGMGGWVLGAFLIGIFLFPLIFLSRTKPVSEKTFLFLAGATMTFDVGVGWWQPWTLIFVFALVLWGGFLFRSGGTSGGGGVG